MLDDMMGKLQQMKQFMDESKQRLENITVTGEAENGAIKITINGNRVVKDITINEDLLKDKEELQEILVVAMNRAIDEATKINEAEMAGSAKSFWPGL